MPVDIDNSSLPKFRKKLPEKLKQIRERAARPRKRRKGCREVRERQRRSSGLSLDALLETQRRAVREYSER